MDSLHKPKGNPNQNTHWAAPKSHCRTWNFSLKPQLWKSPWRAIQGRICVSIACSKVIGHIPIKNNNQNARNWYTAFQIFHKKLIIVFSNLGIFITFYSWILIPHLILKLTNAFNCLFICYTRLCHVWVLGFAEFEIGDFETRKNWNLWPLPLESSWLDEEDATLAINLWTL